MSTQVPINAMPLPAMGYDFKPSYNAVQLNLKQPTLNVPQAQPVQQQNSPATANNQNCWIA